MLYLPDSPDGQFLRRYDSLEAARKGLFNLCAHDKWVTYLAGRALQGNVRAHDSRINQAVLKNFDALIGVGGRWPTTTSLAAHLLDAHMGRLIEAHRGTSRSNDALYMERYALKGPRAFNYIKMAMGMLPFIGSAVRPLRCLDQREPGGGGLFARRGGRWPGGSRIDAVVADRRRHGSAAWRSGILGRFPGGSLPDARSPASSTGQTCTPRCMASRSVRRDTSVERFAGYEYEKPISLSGLQPATHGLYRGIYRHADGDFIVRQGRIFQVELSKDAPNWRLSGNSRKTYKQPIALDETGHWDTWYGVYGTTLEGGVLGGGQVLGHVADALDPVWPLVIRQRLPRWWADRSLRRRRSVGRHSRNDLADQYNIQ